MSFILSGVYEGEVIGPSGGYACFGAWFRPSPITLRYHVHEQRINDAMRKWWSFLFNDLGLREFFTDEQVEVALSTGVLAINAKNKKRDFILSVTTPFRYHEEFPDTPGDVFALIAAGATPIEAFIATHFIAGSGLRAESWVHHSCFMSRAQLVTDAIYTYMDRLRNGADGGVHLTWGGTSKVPNAIDAAMRKTPTLDAGVAYFKNRQTFVEVKPVARKRTAKVS